MIPPSRPNTVICSRSTESASSSSSLVKATSSASFPSWFVPFSPSSLSCFLFFSDVHTQQIQQLNLASGLALLTIATIISDVLTLYILPNSKRYRSAKIKAVEAEKEKDEEDPMFPTEETNLYQNSVNSLDKTA